MKRAEIWLLTLSLAMASLLLSCGDDEDEPRVCDPAAPDCGEGEVCVYDDEADQFQCEAECDPLDADSCGDGEVCERLEGGGNYCARPVLFRGWIFDSEDESGIAGALVLAADDTDSAVTAVAVTDANGNYELEVPVTRDAHGVPLHDIFTLRASADGYLPYPHGIRPAIPIDAGAAGDTGDEYVLQSVATEVALIPLPADQQGLGIIEGQVEGDFPGGTVVIAECGDPPCPLGYADLDGDYTIFNVPDGDYTVTGYKAGLSLEPEAVTLTGHPHLTDVDLLLSELGLGSVSGQVNMVNPGEGQATSVVLVPESAFMQLSLTFVRGVVPPGLRDPAPGLAPDVTGHFEILEVPRGAYVVLAAFENDLLVRDPDPGIAGTQILHIEIPDVDSQVDIVAPESFKVTGALPMIGPGAEGPEAVDATGFSFEWGDDSSEIGYTLEVYDAFGSLVWLKDDVDKVTGSDTVVVPYAGPDLEPGMYYQWRAVSMRATGPISTTEDLLGVFYLAPVPM